MACRTLLPFTITTQGKLASDSSPAFKKAGCTVILRRRFDQHSISTVASHRTCMGLGSIPAAAMYPPHPQTARSQNQSAAPTPSPFKAKAAQRNPFQPSTCRVMTGFAKSCRNPRSNTSLTTGASMRLNTTRLTGITF